MRRRSHPDGGRAQAAPGGGDQGVEDVRIVVLNAEGHPAGAGRKTRPDARPPVAVGGTENSAAQLRREPACDTAAAGDHHAE